MGRFKVAMEPIKDANKRNLTFQTRRKGIMKKALELTTLCDVNVSMIIHTDDQEPEIFPPDLHSFTSLANLYRGYRIKHPEKIRYHSLSDFFEEKTTKVEEELAVVKKKNMEAKYPTWFDSLNNLSEGQLRAFASGLESKIKDAKNKVESVKNIMTQSHDYHSNNPSPTTVLDVEMLSSLNPCSEDDFDSLSFDVDEFLADENNEFSLQYPQPENCYPPEILQPQPPSFSDQYKLVMQSSNPDSFRKLPTVDDYNHSYNHDQYYSSFQPTPFCISPEIPIPQQPKTQSSSYKNNSIMQSSNPSPIQTRKSDIECFIDENFSLQPPSSNYDHFQQEISKQPELPVFSDKYNASMQSWTLDSATDYFMNADI